MTIRAAVTQAQITRAIKATLAAGLRVTAIRPDGTIIVDGEDVPVVAESAPEMTDDEKAYADE